ncbi:MAG: HypC/HybG/HupF family hydrogenase formation chaperone [Elusimicrobiales bacterium]|jgi:hydrogenase expression/formation protein HypC|nr:HypC/HybG/HupF family hydrogenase formation chaperone [Elusimicrobiales bacterium]
MCLSVPAKIINIKEFSAVVDFGNMKRDVSIMLLPEAKIGDYVLVHAGFAIQLLKEDDAKKTLDAFKEIYEAE